MNASVEVIETNQQAGHWQAQLKLEFEQRSGRTVLGS